MRRFRRGRRGVTFMRYSFTSEAIRRGCRGASGKPPCFSAGIFISRGFSANYGPKGPGGERREARAQWAQPPKAVSDPEFRQTTSGAHGSAIRADWLPVVFFTECGPKGVQGGERKAPLLAPQRETSAEEVPLWWGLTRRLRRGGRACSPMGRSHFSFGGERKVCKRKPAARRLREKALYCPF